MYAVVKTGGKQVRMNTGDAIRIEKLGGEVGDTIEFNNILMLGGEEGVTIGTPQVDGAKVVGTITAQGRHPKIRVFKMKRRKGYRRTQGHRQSYTEVRVESIVPS
ncbi:MAG: 50S ribosomal protein L21 [Myxococcota bacterium]